MNNNILFSVLVSSNPNFNTTCVDVYGPTKEKLNNSKPVEIFNIPGRYVWNEWKSKSKKLNATSEEYKYLHREMNWKLRVLKEQHIMKEKEKQAMENEEERVKEIARIEKNLANTERRKEVKKERLSNPIRLRRSKRIQAQQTGLISLWCKNR